MATYFLDVVVCDEQGLNCAAPVVMEISEIPKSSGWFGLQAGSAQYWDVIWSFALLMAAVWSVKAILKFIRR